MSCERKATELREPTLRTCPRDAPGVLYPPAHPYHWPVIGSMEDLARATMDDVSRFFQTYYAPNNACLSVAGNFVPDAARKSIARLFGIIPSGPPVLYPAIAPVRNVEQRTVTLPDAVQLPRLYCAWHSDRWNTGRMP